MSKSFMDAIRGVVLNEGAKEKTSDGMTSDAKHFAQDLHKVSDAGFKHMVQKDSETADYEKMFSGNVDKAPTRLADVEPGQDVNKYVEYNEHLEIEEAKKAAKAERGCSKDCDCDDCSSDDDKEDVKEDLGVLPINVAPSSAKSKKSGPNYYGVKGGQGITAYNTNRDPNFKPTTPKTPPAWGAQAANRLNKPTTPASAASAAPAPKPASLGSSASGAAKNTASAAKTNPGIAKLNSGKPAYKPPASAQTSGPNRGLVQKSTTPSTNPAISKMNARPAPTPSSSNPAGQTSGPNRGLAQKPSTASPSTQTSGPNRGLAQPKSPSAKASPSTQTSGPNRGLAQPAAPGGARPGVVAKNTPSTKPSAPAAKPTKPSGQAAKSTAPAAKPTKPSGQAAKSTAPAAKPKMTPLQQQMARSKTGRDAAQTGVTTGKVTGSTATSRPSAPAKKTPVGTNPLKNSYEFEINGTSYLVSEAHASAIAAFIEKYGEVNEVLTKSTTAGETISDFVHSKNPKFKGKSKNKRIQMALASYYEKQRK